MRFPKVVEQPVMHGVPGKLHSTERYKAIVDFDSGKLFSIVTKDYQLIRHEEVIEEVERAIQWSPGLGRYQTFTRFQNEGGRMRRTYRFPEVTVEIAPNDEVNPEMHLLNSYDCSWPFVVLLGAFRIVCTNGLVVWKEVLHIQRRHVGNTRRISLQDKIAAALECFQFQTHEWKRWADQELTHGVYNHLMEAMKFGKKATEEIEDRIAQEAGGWDDKGFPVLSLWGFFNILTWYITHRAASLTHRVAMEARLRSAMTSGRFLRNT